ncbi:GDSL-type esterase/lipase family protein [Albibacillus kandeliae]|uniref:GDSL-type esterase/lipase family protein n=1 Tax=Albibacillus kandeliae TaxID=2174228 RepID=UPI000D695265|nr:GDSL-type esterase/lipase family protein [Albibacillus kandeliae]
MTSLVKPAAAMGVALSLLAQPTAAEQWAQAWMAAPQAVWTDTSLFATGLPERIAGATIRQPLTLGYSADRLRLVLSNLHGTRALRVEAASVAPSLGGAATGPSARVSFGGQDGVTIAAGAEAVSDPVAFSAAAGDRIAATLRFGAEAESEDFHWDARETSYVIGADTEMPEVLSEMPARLTLSGVLTDHQPRAVVVAMGDSITDGNGAPMDGAARWPDYLSRRLAPEGVSVINAGISGGRLLSDGMGRSVLARLDRDLLAVPGATTLVLLIGTNDIAWPGTPFAPEEAPMTLGRMTAGLQQVAAQVHARGMRLVLGTVPPFRGALPGTPLEASYWSPAKDRLRRELNDWLRATDIPDALVDFDAVLRDPTDDSRLAEINDSGDRLHPGAAGNAAMADAIPLTILLGDFR